MQIQPRQYNWFWTLSNPVSIVNRSEAKSWLWTGWARARFLCFRSKTTKSIKKTVYCFRGINVGCGVGVRFSTHFMRLSWPLDGTNPCTFAGCTFLNFLYFIQNVLYFFTDHILPTVCWCYPRSSLHADRQRSLPPPGDLPVAAGSGTCSHWPLRPAEGCTLPQGLL